MVTTRYPDQQGSKSRQKVMRLCKQWHRPISKRFNKPHYSISRAASIDSLLFKENLNASKPPDQSKGLGGNIGCRDKIAYPRSAFSPTKRINYYAPTSFDQQIKSKFLKATNRTKIRKIEIPRSMVVEALSW